MMPDNTKEKTTKKRILLADDEETLRLSIEQVLSEDGYEVITARDGLEALEMARAESFDLVITDIRMPGLSGLQLVEEVKKSDPLTKFVVISAFGTMETVIEAMRLGVNDFAAKPFKVKSMKEIVRRILSVSKKSPGTENVTKSTASAGGTGGESDNILIRPDLSCHLDESQEASPGGSSVFFDAVDIAEKKLALIYGSTPADYDGAGNNTPLLGTMVKAVFRTLVNPLIMSDEPHGCNRPKHVVEKINKYLCLNTKPRVPVSLFCALIDEGVIEYANHGQKLFCCLVKGDSKIETLESSPYALNQFPDMHIEEKKTSITSESKLVFSSSDSFAALSIGGEAEKADLAGAFADAFSSQKGATSKPKGRAKKAGQSVGLGKETVRKIRAGLFDAMPEGKLDNDWVVMGVNLSRKGIFEQKYEKIVIPATTNDFQGIVSQLEDILKGFGIAPREEHSIITAINEAVINARLFAYNNSTGRTGKGGKKGDIVVRFMVVGDELIVEVLDGGNGFNVQSCKNADVADAQSVTEESGRGIFLIKKLMNRVMIQSSGNIGTRVYMAKEVASNGG